MMKNLERFYKKSYSSLHVVAMGELHGDEF